MERIGNTVSKLLNRRDKVPPAYNVNFVSDAYVQNYQDPKKLRSAHTDGVLCLFSIQPGLCLSGSIDKHIVLYDYDEGEIKQTWRGHTRDVTKVVYESDHRLVISGSRDNNIIIWKHDDTNPYQILSEHQLGITGLALCNKSGIHLCSGSRDNSVRLWDINDGRSIATQTVSRNLVTDLKWSPCSTFIAQTSEDKKLRLWDPRNLEMIDAFPKKNHIQTCCDISPDSRYCITGSIGFSSNGCEATLWDVRQRQIIHEYYGHKESIEACAFLPSPGHIVTLSRDGTIKIWKEQISEIAGSLIMENVGTMTAIVSPTNTIFLVATMKKGIQRLDVISTCYQFIMKRISQF